MNLGTLLADTIKLKNGTEYQGRVLKENADSYDVEIQHSKHVKDRRTIKRSEVQSIIKLVKNHSKEIASVQALIPTPDQLTTEDYDSLLKQQIEPLQALDLSEEEAQEVSKLSEILLEEKSRTIAGELKVSGKWISFLTHQKNLYGIDSQHALAKLKMTAKARASIPTLIEFELFEKEFGNSQHLSEAMKVAMKSINSYEPFVLDSLANYEERLAKREASALSLSLRDQRNAKQETLRLEQEALARAKSAKSLKKKWFQPYSYEKTGLTQIAQSLKSEGARLSKAIEMMEAKKQTEGTSTKTAEYLYRSCYELAKSGDLVEAKKNFSAVKSLKLPPKYLAVLEEQITLREQIVENQKAEEMSLQEASKMKDKTSKMKREASNMKEVAEDSAVNKPVTKEKATMEKNLTPEMTKDSAPIPAPNPITNP